MDVFVGMGLGREERGAPSTKSFFEKVTRKKRTKYLSPTRIQGLLSVGGSTKNEDEV